MLERLGFKAFAYDYRAEHIPTFDAEIEALQKHHIRLLAWWFPTQLNGEARQILAVLKKHNIHTQLWVMGGGTSTTFVEGQRQRVEAEAARIRPIAEAAEKIGCQVGLYNHGGWFGEPENQLAILKALHMPNVGIVYNLHHGHEHLGRFRDLLAQMKPHLLALSLNGMDQDGQKNGRQILPIGAGQLDLQLLRIIRDSGWRGPIGILNHTDLDAKHGCKTISKASIGSPHSWMESLPAQRQSFERLRRHRKTRRPARPLNSEVRRSLGRPREFPAVKQLVESC
jgi:sugar phosphate isomerase/epimerase